MLGDGASPQLGAMEFTDGPWVPVAEKWADTNESTCPGTRMNVAWCMWGRSGQGMLHPDAAWRDRTAPTAANGIGPGRHSEGGAMAAWLDFALRLLIPSNVLTNFLKFKSVA